MMQQERDFDDQPAQAMPSGPSGYSFDENMADPFGSKKPAVMNSPAKRDPMEMGGGGSYGAAS